MADLANSALTRRTAISLLAAAATFPAIALVPKRFDPIAYIADMRAAGVHVSTSAGYLFFSSPDGFGDKYRDVCFKWAHARKAEPNCNDLTIDALLNERD